MSHPVLSYLWGHPVLSYLQGPSYPFLISGSILLSPTHRACHVHSYPQGLSFPWGPFHPFLHTEPVSYHPTHRSHPTRGAHPVLPMGPGPSNPALAWPVLSYPRGPFYPRVRPILPVETCPAHEDPSRPGPSVWIILPYPQGPPCPTHRARSIPPRPRGYNMYSILIKVFFMPTLVFKWQHWGLRRFNPIFQ